MIHFMPPLPLVVLLALYWSTQVCMRALPALSLAYFGSTADGNTALPIATGGAAGAAAAASVPHCALRKSLHFWPFSEPSALAALYFALHSDMLSAWAGETA